MENKTPYSEIFLAVEEAFGKTPTNGEIDDFVTELAKRGIVLTKFHPMTKRPEDLETIQIFFGCLLCGSYQYKKVDDSAYINGSLFKKWGDLREDGYSWTILPTAPKSENNS